MKIYPLHHGVSFNLLTFFVSVSFKKGETIMKEDVNELASLSHKKATIAHMT